MSDLGLGQMEAGLSNKYRIIANCALGRPTKTHYKQLGNKEKEEAVVLVEHNF